MEEHFDAHSTLHIRRTQLSVLWARNVSFIRRRRIGYICKMQLAISIQLRKLKLKPYAAQLSNCRFIVLLSHTRSTVFYCEFNTFPQLLLINCSTMHLIPLPSESPGMV